MERGTTGSTIIGKHGKGNNIKPKILNLSKHKLTPGQVSLLCRGPKFCPTTKGNLTDVCGDNYAFARRLELHEMFFDKVSSDSSLIRKPSHKYISSSVKELSNITAAVRRIEPAKIGMGNNLSQLEEVALRELKELTRTEIEVKKADKTNTLVIMDKADYRDQLVHQCHLATNSYEQTEENIDKRVHNKIKKFCNKFDGCLTKSEKDAIIDDDWATSNFYVLPKINKSATVVSEISKAQKECVEMNMPTDLKSRPIVSGPKSVTQGISKLLEKILTPLVTTLRSFIKDERDFLRKFPKNINKDSRIVCCDVVSLYTSIPNELGLKAIEFWIGKLRHLLPNCFSKDFILVLVLYWKTTTSTSTGRYGGKGSVLRWVKKLLHHTPASPSVTWRKQFCSQR